MKRNSSRNGSRSGSVNLRLFRRVVVEDGNGLVDLGVKRIVGVEETNELFLIHLKKHTRDLAGKLLLRPDEILLNRYHTSRKKERTEWSCCTQVQALATP